MYSRPLFQSSLLLSASSQAWSTFTRRMVIKCKTLYCLIQVTAYSRHVMIIIGFWYFRGGSVSSHRTFYSGMWLCCPPGSSSCTRTNLEQLKKIIKKKKNLHPPSSTCTCLSNLCNFWMETGLKPQRCCSSISRVSFLSELLTPSEGSFRTIPSLSTTS